MSMKRFIRMEFSRAVVFNSSAAGSATLMDKPHPSRKQEGRARFLTSLAFAWVLAAVPALAVVALSHADALRIGKKIWQNECNGTVAGLTAWNEGEDFPSLGIGHFIWYPQGKRGPFEESFPELVSFMSSRGAKLPKLLLGAGGLPCPWNSRAEFFRAQQTTEMKELRQFLADTVDLQAEFLVNRLETALPKMLGEAALADRENVRQQFERVASTLQGCYALVDYVNFKGEGVLATERYRGQGWGLLQVLEGMTQSGRGQGAVEDFSRSARAVLTRRVQNAPGERNESRWLSGWIHRVNSYTRR